MAEATMQRDYCTVFASLDWQVCSHARGGRSSSILTHMTRYKDFLVAVAICAILLHMKAVTHGLEALCQVN